MAENIRQISPLRYPGGKSRIAGFIEDIILLNNLENCTLYELYAGGAGASLTALFSGICERIVLNDLDPHIYSFWESLLNHTQEFVDRIRETPVNMDSWYVQKDIYMNANEFSVVEIGFSTFFLNRCNRSGILQAGPIGGKNQNGNYLIDVRFNKENLIQRIGRIANKRSQIELRNSESIELLDEIFSNENDPYFVFLDPPYYVQGENLYLNSYNDDDHEKLSRLLKTSKNSNWLLTYDNVDRIRELYSTFSTALLPMTYTLQNKMKAKELMVFSDNLFLPSKLKLGSKSEILEILNHQ